MNEDNKKNTDVKAEREQFDPDASYMSSNHGPDAHRPANRFHQ